MLYGFFLFTVQLPPLNLSVPDKVFILNCYEKISDMLVWNIYCFCVKSSHWWTVCKLQFIQFIRLLGPSSSSRIFKLLKMVLKYELGRTQVTLYLCHILSGDHGHDPCVLLVISLVLHENEEAWDVRKLSAAAKVAKVPSDVTKLTEAVSSNH